MEVIYNHEFPRRLKTAFIGCGGHAIRNVYPTFQYAPVDLAAVCDLDESRARHVARIFGAPQIYTDHRTMLAAEKPEVVFIVTNYDENGRSRYPALAIDAMKAGAHVWIEKPPASSIDEVRAMTAISQATGRHVAVGLKKMFFPANVKAAEIIARPEFGRVTSITARYPQALPPLADRGDTRKMIGFLDHMVHPHAVLRLLGGELDWIFVNRNEAVGSATIALRFKSGAAGSLHLASGGGAFGPMERTEVIGEGASVTIDNNIRVTYHRPGRGLTYGRTGSYFGADEIAPLHWEPEFSLGQLYNKGLFLLGYAPEVIHFTTRLLEGLGPEKGTLADALEMMKIYEAYRRADAQIVSVE